MEKTDKYDYLLKSGWSEKDAKRLIELEEKGFSPKQAFEAVKGGADSEKQIKVEHYVEEPETSDSEDAQKKYAEAKTEASELYEKTKDYGLRAAGLKERNVKETAISTAGKILKAMKPKPLTKEQKEIQQAYNEARYRSQVERAKAQGRASGFGGYNVAKQPTKIKVVRTMKPPAHQDLPGGNMGMDIESGSNPVGHIPSGNFDVGFRLYERQPAKIVRADEPVGKIPQSRREPVNYNPVNNPGANSLVSLGNVRNPVNIDNRAVSTRIPRTEKVSVKFKGRKPRTETRKPKIETKVVTEKKFWEW